MKRGILVLLSLSMLLAVAFFTANKWAIRHETIAFHDPDRNNRLVAVNVAVRRDKEMQANAGLIKLPVAILNHGNTVKNTEYSFLSTVFAWRGYLAISPQSASPMLAVCRRFSAAWPTFISPSAKWRRSSPMLTMRR